MYKKNSLFTISYLLSSTVSCFIYCYISNNFIIIIIIFLCSNKLFFIHERHCHTLRCYKWCKKKNYRSHYTLILSSYNNNNHLFYYCYCYLPMLPFWCYWDFSNCRYVRTMIFYDNTFLIYGKLFSITFHLHTEMYSVRR